MFDHVGIAVSHFARSVRFYEAALAPLGYVLQSHDPNTSTAGFGKPGAPQLWLGAGKGGPVHLAFVAEDRESVKKFHAAALEAGGKNHGDPGPRPAYGENYYAAFVYDPDGNNVEAVCLKAR
jgi:catechol 2,3-dioxygenase-like lactoylglutathione lyase family enzyme